MDFLLYERTSKIIFKVGSWEGGDADSLRAEQAGGDPALRCEKELQRRKHPTFLQIGKPRHRAGPGDDPGGAEWGRSHQTGEDLRVQKKGANSCQTCPVIILIVIII